MQFHIRYRTWETSVRRKWVSCAASSLLCTTDQAILLAVCSWISPCREGHPLTFPSLALIDLLSCIRKILYLFLMGSNWVWNLSILHKTLTAAPEKADETEQDPTASAHLGNTIVFKQILNVTQRDDVEMKCNACSHFSSIEWTLSECDWNIVQGKKLQMRFSYPKCCKNHWAKSWLWLFCLSAIPCGHLDGSDQCQEFCDVTHEKVGLQELLSKEIKKDKK